MRLDLWATARESCPDVGRSTDVGALSPSWSPPRHRVGGVVFAGAEVRYITGQTVVIALG